MATAPVSTLPVVNVGAVPYAKVDALPVVVITGGDPPLLPVNAQQVVVVTAPYPMAPVAARPVMMMAGDVPQSPAMPVPVIIVG